MSMPSEVVAQVHHLKRQAKSKRTLTFTSTRNGDLDVLYATTKYDGNDVNPAHANDKLAGMDGEGEDNTSDEN